MLIFVGGRDTAIKIAIIALRRRFSTREKIERSIDRRKE